MYEDISNKINRISDAQNVLTSIRSVYGSLVEVRALLQRYVADPVFQQTVNELFTAQEIVDLAAIVNKMNDLCTDLETNHRDAIGV